MKNLMWLIKREYWENKNLYLRMPVIVALILLVLILLIAVRKMPTDDEIQLIKNGMQETLGRDKFFYDASIRQFLNVLNYSFSGFLFFFLLISSVVSFSYFSQALSADRMDKSILFWKSLPISDRDTVLSKLALPLIFAPLLSAFLAFVIYLILVLFITVFAAVLGYPSWSLLGSNLIVFLIPIKFLVLLPIYFLWALPTAAWILMVSSWAKSRAIVWAFGVPLLFAAAAIFLEHQLQLNWNMRTLAGEGLSRLLLSTLPGAWMGESIPKMGTAKDLPNLFLIAQETLSGWKIWAGAAAGVAMLFATVQLRRHRTEV
jgi:ABC-2 type transport system permease protein